MTHTREKKKKQSKEAEFKVTKDGISMGILYVALIDILKDLDENMSIMKKQLEDKKKRTK